MIMFFISGLALASVYTNRYRGKFVGKRQNWYMGFRIMALTGITSYILDYYMDPRQQSVHNGILMHNSYDKKAAIVFDRELDVYRNVERIKYKDKRFSTFEILWAQKEMRDEQRKYV